MKSYFENIKPTPPFIVHILLCMLFTTTSCSSCGKLDHKHDELFGIRTQSTIYSNNVLSPKDIDPQKENQYYIIDKNYNLNGQTLQLPKGCVLDFRGGSISNGTLQANFATIVAPEICIFTPDVKLIGNWQNYKLPVEWFGAIGDNNTNCTEAINAAINNTTIKVVTLMAGAEYIVDAPIIMRTKDFSFGCFEVSYSHESSPAATITSNCSDHVLVFPEGETIAGINIKGLVIEKKQKFRHKGNGIHIEGGAFYRSIFEGVRIYNCKNGFYEHFGKGYRGFSLNKMQNCVFGRCIVGFQLTHDLGGEYSYWVNLNSWDNCQFSFNQECGLWINNAYSCEQNLFSSCGFEANSLTENKTWNNSSDICGAKLNGQGYGLSTFLNCYFEQNHPKKYLIQPTSALNETSYYSVADVLIEGMFVNFDKCTFNDGITPVIIKDGKIGVNIEKTLFRIGYESDCMVMFKGISEKNIGAGNYFNLDIPYIENRYRDNPTKDIKCTTKSLSKTVKYSTVR